jgi:hypothetical protein
MTRVAPLTSFHSSQLIRCLAELDLLEGAEPKTDFADELGQWMHFTDAIALASVLESGMAKAAAQSQDLRQAARTRMTAEFERIRAFMVNSITKSCAPTGNTHIKLPLVTEQEVSYTLYKRFYEEHQRDMEASVEPLRVNLRAALAKASPQLKKLAELDVVMEKFLRAREGQLLARVPLLLKKHFDAQYAAHVEQVAASGQPDNRTDWMKAGGWLARFCQTLQTLLLAEADLRLQPSAGLLDALNQHKDNE